MSVYISIEQKTKTMKRILFYLCLLGVIISFSSVLNLTTVIVGTTAMCGLLYIVSEMSRDELYKVSGAYWFNKVFNTNSFTEEE